MDDVDDVELVSEKKLDDGIVMESDFVSTEHG